MCIASATLAELGIILLHAHGKEPSDRCIAFVVDEVDSLFEIETFVLEVKEQPIEHEGQAIGTHEAGHEAPRI
jgi:hypothetical protein